MKKQYLRRALASAMAVAMLAGLVPAALAAEGETHLTLSLIHI